MALMVESAPTSGEIVGEPVGLVTVLEQPQ
jgi:hypothetical protein